MYAKSPSEIDYTAYGISNAILVDNTGVWRDRKGLSQHLKAKGIGQVVLTAPGKGGISNIVFGVNSEIIKPILPTTKVVPEALQILSAASCSTNAVVPVLKVLDEKYGIVSGHIETVHSYTNDQNLLDNYHKKARRGRAAPINMVLTETGAGSAVAKCLPNLLGKLTANAIRVPTPNVSLAILQLRLARSASKVELNEVLIDESDHGKLQNQIGVVESKEIVSSDIVGDRHASVVDLLSTIVKDDVCNLYCWYDNEFGYSCQVVRILQKMSGVTLMKYPPPSTKDE